MIRVYTDMVADLFHYGHVEFLKQARAMGDYLLVGVCADDVVEAHKRRPILTMEERVVSVAGCRYVDEVIPNAPWRFDPTWIEKYDVHLVVHGDDYAREQQVHHYGVPIEKGIFRTLPYTKGVVVQGKCQGILFRDYVSRRLVFDAPNSPMPHGHQAFA